LLRTKAIDMEHQVVVEKRIATSSSRFRRSAVDEASGFSVAAMLWALQLSLNNRRRGRTILEVDGRELSCPLSATTELIQAGVWHGRTRVHRTSCWVFVQILRAATTRTRCEDKPQVVQLTGTNECTLRTSRYATDGQTVELVWSRACVGIALHCSVLCQRCRLDRVELAPTSGSTP
jgi:hypothetical protein